MPILKADERGHIVPDLEAHVPVTNLRDVEVEEELDAMVTSIGQLNYQLPDQVMVTTMAYMARLTEMWMHMSRNEGRHKRAKLLKVQVQKTMDLMDFQFRAASRILETMKFEMELSK